MRIGFLFNHDASHQIGHALPIALAMRSQDVDISLFVSPGKMADEVKRLWQHAGGDLSVVVELRSASTTSKIIKHLSGNAIPADRVDILRRNVEHFRALDGLVVPEKTALMLKTRFGLQDLKLIHTRHGAGDRAVGFDPPSAGFDLVLVSGEKIRDRLQKAGLLETCEHAIVGYPKFDALKETAEPDPLFNNQRPTVLYNPHPSPALSSWYSMGNQVMDYFANSQQFNLIFAPHVMLFTKKLNISLSPFSVSRVPQPDWSLHSLPHMHLDAGSQASVDMTYTRLADIYLGDASSQVYEFLYQPRPCVFVNAQQHEWRGDENYSHWQCGPVVSSIHELDQALQAAVEDLSAYNQQQRRLFDYSFAINQVSSAQRAADSIIEYLQKHENPVHH